MQRKQIPVVKPALKLSLALLAMSAATSYAQTYNCATDSGCVPIKEQKVTSDYTATKYPVVLAHGSNGWNKLLNITDYFHGIPEDLSANGASVYLTKTTAVQDSEYRGEELLKQVKAIAAITGSPKVNLIGYDQGGNDIRYVAAVAPEYVSSVTAIASPLQGTKMADWFVSSVEKSQTAQGLSGDDLSFGGKLGVGFLNLMGSFTDAMSALKSGQLEKQDGWSAVKSMSSKYAADFNQKFPQGMPTSYCELPTQTRVNGIDYYSMGGVGNITTFIDPSDIKLSLLSLAYGKEPNDGIVGQCSTHLGRVIRDNYQMNHLDMVNQIFGLVSLTETNPVAMYRQHVNRLKESGL